MKTRFAFTLSIALLVTACGGGGNGAPATVTPPVNPLGLVIDAANAKPAVRVAYGATMQALDTGALVGSSGIASSGNDGFSKLSSNDAFAAAFRRALQKVPLGPDVYPCLIGGTVTISGDLASLFTLTPGDRINIEYVDCDDDLGEVLNGRIEMTVATYSGDVILGILAYPT